jgi:hypothetical protein
MSLIGSIVIGMTARTEQFQKGLARARKQIDGFRRQVAPAVTAVAKLGAQLTTAASAGLGALAFRMADVVDKTGDAADRLGTTTAALSELRYAAKLTGSETETLDAALTKMNINLGKAVTEGGPVADVLNRLGLDARTLAEQDPTEAFRTIADKIAKLGTEAERSAAEVAIFGKSGAGLANTINAGSAGIDKYADEFRRLGGSVSETSRQMIAQTMDSLDRAQAAVGGLGTQLAAQLSPFVEAAANKFVELMTAGQGMGANVGAAIEYVATGIGIAADITQVLVLAFKGAQAFITTAIGGVIKGIALLGKAVESVINLVPGMKVTFASNLDAIADGIIDAGKTLGDEFMRDLAKPAWSERIKEGFRGIKANALAAADAVKKSGQEIRKVAEGPSDKWIEEMHKGLAKDAADVIDRIKSPMEKFQDELDKVNSLESYGYLDEQQASKARKAAEKEHLGDEKPKFAGALDVGSSEYRSALLNATTGRTDGFRNVEKNTGSAARDLRELVQLVRAQGRNDAPTFEMH